MDYDSMTLVDFVDAPGTELFSKAWRASAYRNEWIRKGFYTYERVMLTPNGNRVVVRDGSQVRQMVMMASNNFLGLNSHPRLIRAGKKALDKYGVGSGGAPMLSGTTGLHRALEERCADFLGAPAALVFSTGYAANQGTLAALLRKGETGLLDEQVHASIIDGAMRAEGRMRTFAHNDVASLQSVLESLEGRRRGRLIVVDGAYSMSGDLSPIPEILDVASAHSARVMVDEAHCLGVLGARGRGSCEHYGVAGKVDIIVGTFSKAFGVMGGFVATNREVDAYLRLYARTYFFSTAPAPVQVACALEAFNVVEAEPERREQLWENIRYMQHGLRQLGYEYGNPHCAIISIIVGDNPLLVRFNRDLHQAGIYASAVPYPAVPRDQCRIRLGIMSTHTREDMDLTLDALRRLGRKHGVLQ